MEPKYRRVLLKLSGESLMGKQGYGIDSDRLNEYARQIMEICSMGVQVAIVIGGGNIFRGVSGAAKGFNRVGRPDGYARHRHQFACALVGSRFDRTAREGVYGAQHVSHR